jgi:hypothetical protein
MPWSRLAGLKDPKTGTFFRDLKAQHRDTTRPNNIFPRPCEFINQDLPDCSIVRPTLSEDGGAMAALKFLTGAGLFKGGRARSSPRRRGSPRR